MQDAIDCFWSRLGNSSWSLWYERKGPLQAFNVSEPLWFDGLTKNEMMQNLRSLWLTKLEVIHKYIRTELSKPGPVDDWKNKKDSKQRVGRQLHLNLTEIKADESMSFGDDFDPTDWL